MVRASSRSASNSGSLSLTFWRLSMKPEGTLRSARCSCASPSAWPTLCLKLSVRGSTRSPGLADCGLCHLSRQRLRHVPHLYRRAQPLELPRHVHEAAQVAGEQHLGAAGGDVLDLLLHHVIGDIGI